MSRLTLANSIVRLRGISKTFDNTIQALKDFNLVVKRNEFVSLVGPSGCGKSTLLRIIAGLITPSTGAVEVGFEERETGNIKTNSDFRVSFVFQDPALMPWATVFENVWLPLRLRNISKRKATPKVMEQLRKMGLDIFANSYPKELSGGAKMLVSIARALVTRPQLLLMDEPFGTLDEITRFEMNDQLLELHTSGDGTVVFVTHSVYESVYLSNRIVVISSRPGRVVGEVKIDEHDLLNRGGFRDTPAYHDYCRRVSFNLRAAAKTNAQEKFKPEQVSLK